MDVTKSVQYGFEEWKAKFAGTAGPPKPADCRMSNVPSFLQNVVIIQDLEVNGLPRRFELEIPPKWWRAWHGWLPDSGGCEQLILATRGIGHKHEFMSSLTGDPDPYTYGNLAQLMNSAPGSVGKGWFYQGNGAFGPPLTSHPTGVGAIGSAGQKFLRIVVPAGLALSWIKPAEASSLIHGAADPGPTSNFPSTLGGYALSLGLSAGFLFWNRSETYTELFDTTDTAKSKGRRISLGAALATAVMSDTNVPSAIKAGVAIAGLGSQYLNFATSMAEEKHFWKYLGGVIGFGAILDLAGCALLYSDVSNGFDTHLFLQLFTPCMWAATTSTSMALPKVRSWMGIVDYVLPIFH